MRWFTLFIVVSFLGFYACQSDNKTTKEASVMYKDSELALLMRHMHDESALWKEAILKDDFKAEFPSDFYGIYTVQATDSTVRTAQFTAMADAYIGTLKDLMEVEKNKKQVKKFNTSIDACVSCHNIFCQGPIEKIEKLYIKE